MPDAAPLLQGQRGLAHIGEDRAHIVANFAHDEAVEEGNVTLRAGTREHPPGRDEREACHGVEKTPLPSLTVCASLGRRSGLCHPSEGILYRALRFARRLEAVFGFPYLLRDRN